MQRGEIEAFAGDGKVTSRKSEVRNRNCIVDLTDDSRARFSAARATPLRVGSLRLGNCRHGNRIIMKNDLVKAACEVVTNQQILVNMVSRRVRQLCLGHRPMVEHAPGLREADIALMEIAAGKLTFESTLDRNGACAQAEATHVVQFPGILVEKKKPKKKAA
jgi:DNA-directed RNA polymerase subunit K/omega